MIHDNLKPPNKIYLLGFITFHKFFSGKPIPCTYFAFPSREEIHILPLRAGSNRRAGRKFHKIFWNEQALISASRLEKSWFFSLRACSRNRNTRVTSISHVGGFSFFVFLNPWASIVKFWIVFCLGKDFLFKSNLAGCA